MEEVVELKRSGRRLKQYLDWEIKTLAKMRFKGFISHEISDPNFAEEKNNCVSLERFGLAEYVHVFINGAWRGWAWCATKEGIELLTARKPVHYGCRCEYSIRLPCVCVERTYCPNPDHEGNGCHGGHD